MIYFEDLVIKSHELLDKGYCYNLSAWSKNFIHNVADNLLHKEEPRLSTNQAAALQKVLPSFIRYLALSGNHSKESLELMIAKPIFKRPLYVSPAVKREVRHLGANFLGFRFKYNPQLAKNIQTAASQGYFRFDKKTKLWIITLVEVNFENVIRIIKDNRFETDLLTDKWISACSKDAKTVCEFDIDTNCIVVHSIANTRLNTFVQTFLEGIHV